MGTIGGLKGTLGPLTKEQRLAIKSKQVNSPARAALGTKPPAPTAALLVLSGDEGHGAGAI